MGLGVLIRALAAGVALAVLEVGNNNPNALRVTFGDDKGQDTLSGCARETRLSAGAPQTSRRE